jgi:hypothetical protein
MKTIEIPDDLYWKVFTKSVLHRRRPSVAAAEVLQRWVEEEEPVTAEQAADLARLEEMERVYRLANEIMKDVPPGPSAREMLEQDRSRLD